MTPKLIALLGGVQLPDQTQLLETTTPNEADVMTLDGSLYTDFVNLMRSWTIGFPYLTQAEFDPIYELYKSQYTNETYLAFEVDQLGITTIVKVNISDKDIHFNGQQVYGFSLTLKEAYAIS